MNHTIFRKSSVDRISSPEQLNDYIKVSNPSVWVVLTAIAILLVSVLIWGVFGSLETSVTTKAICNGNLAICYLEDASGIEEGMTVSIGTVRGVVTTVSQEPLSKKDFSAKYSDEYTVYAIAPPEWSYEVTIHTEQEIDGIASLSILTERIHPISFLWN